MNALEAPEILDLYRQAGDAQYAGEPVTQLQHAWQCGQLARLAGAPQELQLASWLHDLGHLIKALPGTPTLRGEDDRHEAVAAPVLQALWGQRVADPVRLHVQAKRYLVGRHPLTNRAFRKTRCEACVCKVVPWTPMNSICLNSWPFTAMPLDSEPGTTRASARAGSQPRPRQPWRSSVT